VGQEGDHGGGMIQAAQEDRPLSHTYLQETIEPSRNAVILAPLKWFLWNVKLYGIQDTYAPILPSHHVIFIAL
jgi:hypothetical protein